MDAALALESAEIQGKPARQIARLRADVERKTDAYAAALSHLGEIEETS